jgi:hypothetical protein
MASYHIALLAMFLKVVQRTLELWREKNVAIVDCYLVANLETDAQNIIYKSNLTNKRSSF